MRHSHSFLGLNYTLKGSYELLANHPLSKQFRGRASSLDFILLDEISFISCKFLNYIHLRLQKVKRNQKPFGGIGIIAFGDFYQIPCVIPYQLYDDTEFLPPFAKDCKRCFNSFKQFTFLNLAENCRQVSDTRFQDLRSNIRYRRVSSDNKLLIESRILKNLDKDESSSFSKCLAIFPTNDLE
jgi:ATP-dependent DNA helicase PIF1